MAFRWWWWLTLEHSGMLADNPSAPSKETLQRIRNDTWIRVDARCSSCDHRWLAQSANSGREVKCLANVSLAPEKKRKKTGRPWLNLRQRLAILIKLRQTYEVIVAAVWIQLQIKMKDTRVLLSLCFSHLNGSKCLLLERYYKHKFRKIATFAHTHTRS